MKLTFPTTKTITTHEHSINPGDMLNVRSVGFADDDKKFTKELVEFNGLLTVAIIIEMANRHNIQLTEISTS